MTRIFGRWAVGYGGEKLNQKNEKKHKRNLKKILVFFGMAAAALVLALLAATNITIREMSVKGNEFYTNEEIRDILFDTPLKRNTIYCYLNNRFGEHQSIPFVERYQIEFRSLSSVEVIIYEKNIVGYIEYLGSNLFFDRDGVIVESSSRVIEGVPIVSGLKLDHVILYQKLPVERQDVFEVLLNLTQLFERYEIKADKIFFDKNYNAQVMIGDITVRLGDDENLDLKIGELKNILPKLTGLSGTLYLEGYQENSINTAYVFKKDEEEQPETETETETEPETETGASS